MFPSSKDGEFYEIEWRAEFGDKETVHEKWKLWYLKWVPDLEFRFWITTDAPVTNGVIILIHHHIA